VIFVKHVHHTEAELEEPKKQGIKDMWDKINKKLNG